MRLRVRVSAIGKGQGEVGGEGEDEGEGVSEGGGVGE